MQKWIHIAGVAGRTTSNVARMYSQMGYFVTGSDNNCLPPATDLLDKYNIPYVQGFSFRNLTKEFWEQQLNRTLDIAEVPERAIFVANLSKKNKEYMFAKAKGIKIQTYAQALGEDLIKPESIVSVGTAGKTTTTALLVHILEGLGFEPSYMVGAEFADDRQAIANTDSEWSVMEGDEFYGVNLEPHAKFFEYAPKYVLLNKLEWDHTDVYHSEQEYIDTFRRLIRGMPSDGLIIANAGDENIRSIAQEANCRVRWVGAYDEVGEFTNDSGKKLYWTLETWETGIGNRDSGNGKQQTENGTRTRQTANGKRNSDLTNSKRLTARSYEPQPFELEFSTNLLGRYNHQNVLMVIALLYELFANNIDWNEVANLIESFSGIVKRLQMLFDSENLIIVDDLGGPPVKVRAGLEALHSQYSEFEKIIIYEPNSGNRTRESLVNFESAFELADQVIIPTLSEHDSTLLSSTELVDEISQLGASAKHIETDEINSYLLGEINRRDGEVEDVMGTTDIPESIRPLMIIYFSPFRLTQVARELVEKIGERRTEN